MSILVLGDIHLGLSSGPGIDWALNALSNAHLHGARGFICAGDAIDRARYTDNTFVELNTFFRTAVDLFGPVHFVQGNHDVHHDLDLPSEVTIHSTDAHSFEYHGICVHTASVLSDPDPREVIQDFQRATDSALPRLGVLHTSLTGEYSNKPCLPASLDELLELNLDAWVLAHVHRPIELHADPFIGWVGMGNALVVSPDNDGGLTVTRVENF